MMKSNPILFHSLAARHSTLAIDLDIVREIGFDGLEVSAAKMRAFLDAGFTAKDLNKAFDGVYVPGTGFLVDIERQGEGRAALMREADSLFQLAASAGIKGVQVITGPLSLKALDDASAAATPGLYRGVVGLPLETQIDLTASNLAAVADLAAQYGLLIYLEALSWTPLNTIDRQLRTIEIANRDNIRLVIDFWHCYTSGDTPKRIARLHKDIIYGVHICDSLAYAGGVPDENMLRDVPTGNGVLNLKEWVDAVKSTGYDGWWSCELFCRRQHQENSYDVARSLNALMRDLVGA
ncbi:sugar phosphate isomerase/epimerase [Mesorhizobium sp. WSM4307]|nr:sugar phosphate isomerase/epimerase [Mesorhizobium sp. WSM4315]TRC86436.1 sugar phosphate isomerase/epimerase [Mesorhizobium sp. WSM4307]